MWTKQLQERFLKATELQHDLSALCTETPSWKLLKSLNDVSKEILKILEEAGHRTTWKGVLIRAEQMFHEGKLESFDLEIEEGV